MCLSFLFTQLLDDGLAAVAAVTQAPDICCKSIRFVLWNASPCSLQLTLLHQLVISSWLIPVVLKACLRTSIGVPEIALGRERSPHSGPDLPIALIGTLRARL